MAWTYYRTLTITSNATLHPATQTNFPVLVKISHASMKLVSGGAGGHINNHGNQASGPAVDIPFDLIFTSDSGGTTKIPWEVDMYDSTNGVLWAWVNVASCALSTVFYCFYGDAAVNSAQNTGSYTPALTWDSSFKRIYHLGDATTLIATDSTGNSNGTLVNTPTPAAGQIGGAGSLVAASSQDITFADTLLPTTSNIRTMECWIKMTTAVTCPPLCYGTVASGKLSSLSLTGASPNVHLRFNFSVDILTGTVNMATGIWYHILGVLSAGPNVTIYVNGVQDATTSSISPNTVLNNGRIGCRGDDTQFFNGLLDECRIHSTSRTANWITSNYNTQADPTTFCAIGAETVNSALAIAVFMSDYRRRRI